MLALFLTDINAKHLFSSSDNLLLAVSGGIDSVVLAHLCFEANFSFAIAHCNFQLRGEESDQDAAFVRMLAQKYNVPYYEKSFTTKAFAKDNKISTQMAARALRYEWFEEIRLQHQYQYLLTAHHQDDLVETILLNLVRGTGLAGLHGILPKHGTTVRPLLWATRAQIINYALAHALAWREDSSNASTDYLRNRIRHEVLPLFKSINPQVSLAMAQMAERVYATEHILEEYKLSWQNDIMLQKPEGCYLYYQKLQTLSYPVERLAQLLHPFGFEYSITKQIWQHTPRTAGKQFFSETHTLTQDRHCWLLTPRHVVYPSYELDPNKNYPNLPLRWQSLTHWTLPNSSHEAYVDADLLGWPLTLRPWRKGDWFCPLGLKGKRQKVSDLLINAKVPRSLKEGVYVLESQGKIVWVVNHRLDERFKATPQSKNFIKFYTS